MARRLLLPVAAGALGLALALAVWSSGVLDRPENDSVDVRFPLRAEAPNSEVVIVAIDDETIDNLGRWPFSRRYHAQAIDRLRRAGARLIVYDVQFTEPSPEKGADLQLVRAVARARGTVLATSTSDDRGRTAILGGDAVLDRIGARAAAANLLAEEGGMVRRYERAVGALPSIAVVVSQQLRRGDVRPDRFPDSRAWIDWRGGTGTFPTVSFADLVAGRIEPDRLRGRIVLVGATAPSLQDLHPTPTAQDREMPGVEIHANAIWTALRGNDLRDAPSWMNALALVLLAFVPPLTMVRLKFLTTVGLALGVAAVFCGAIALLFAGGLVVRATPPLLALAIATAAAVTGGALLEARENTRMARSLEKAYREIVSRLAIAAEARDDEMGEHVERLSRLTHRLALAAGLPEREADMLRLASLMHDIGKLAIPDDVLRKPGRLSPEELAVMRRHAAAGSRILQGSDSPLVQLAEVIARTHHEKWDGSGYPAGLRGEQIPLPGRITAVCDVFDALVSPRHYKRAWSVDEALAEITAQRGRHFDPRLVDIFLSELAPDLPELVAEGPAEAGPVATT